MKVVNVFEDRLVQIHSQKGTHEPSSEAKSETGLFYLKRVRFVTKFQYTKENILAS